MELGADGLDFHCMGIKTAASLLMLHALWLAEASKSIMEHRGRSLLGFYFSMWKIDITAMIDF